MAWRNKKLRKLETNNHPRGEQEWSLKQVALELFRREVSQSEAASFAESHRMIFLEASAKDHQLTEQVPTSHVDILEISLGDTT
jgi:hypothetical protein